jgi:hypothetical protein
MGMALTDKKNKKNRRFAGQARMGSEICGFSGSDDRQGG